MISEKVLKNVVAIVRNFTTNKTMLITYPDDIRRCSIDMVIWLKPPSYDFLQVMMPAIVNSNYGIIIKAYIDGSGSYANI